jgi:hypothetical protein
MNFNISDIFTQQKHMNRKVTKLIILVIVSIFFSIIYFFIPDSEFGGINKFQELVRDELIKKKVATKIDKENFQNYYINYQNDIKLDNINVQEETASLQELDPAIEKQLDIKTLETAKLIKESEFKESNYSASQKFLDRLYFAFVTGTTLGYGDVYPSSNRTKLLAITQLLITISLILL